MKRAPRFTVAALGTSLLIAGCGDAPDKTSAADTDDYGSTIELADDYDPDGHFDWAYTSFASSWDPIKSVTGGDSNFYEPVYDRLLREDVNGKILPMLAEEFTPSADGKTLTLQLQQGLTFSDGTPFDAEAVKFNLDRIRAEDSKISGDLHQVDSVNVVDEYTVEIILSGAIGSMPVALANRAGMMVSPTAAQAGALDDGPVGIGPYITSDITPGNKVEYEKTPNYWDPDAQRVATMTYYYMVDDQTRINALKSGQLDAASIPAAEIDSMTSSAGFTPIVQPGPLYLYFQVNTSVEPFGDPEVRKALNMAIDREAISQGLYDGYCTPQIQPFPESSPGYSEKIGDGLDIFPYDPEAAKKILEDKGITDLDVATAAPNITIYTKFAEVMQDQLGAIGINLEIHPLPPAEQVGEFAIEKITPTFTSISTGINDPDVVNSRYISPESLFNPGGMAYPELVQYGAEGASSLDPAERKPAYEKYMDAWVETPPHQIPVCMVHGVSMYADHVSGASQRANGYPDLRGVAVAKE